MNQKSDRKLGGRPLAKSEVNLAEPVVVSDPPSVGALVRAARVSRELSQEEMADRLGVSRGLLAGMERGDRGVRLDLALQILGDLGFTLVALAPDISRQPEHRVL